MSKRFTFFLSMLLLLPFLSLFLLGANLQTVEFHELLPYFKWSLLHSLLTAIVCIFLGYIGALGLLSLSRLKKIVSLFIVLPGFLPVLIVASSLFAITESLNIELADFTLIVICQVFVNLGVVSYLFYKSVVDHHAREFELAHVLNISRVRFICTVLPRHLGTEGFGLFVYVFASCFSGFVIPHLFAPLEPYSLDVLIYRKLRVFGEIGQSIYLTLLQVGFIFAVVFIFRFKRSVQKTKTLQLETNRYSFRLGIFLPLLVSTLIASKEFTSVLKLPDLFQVVSLGDLMPAMIGTMVIAMLSFLFCYLLLQLFAVSSMYKSVKESLLAYVAPSGVLLGLVVVAFGVSDYSLLSISFCFAFVSAIVVYRLGFYTELKLLEPQVTSAKACGVNDKNIFHKILFPQVNAKAFYLSGIVAFWSVGEYTLSMMIADSDVTLSLWIKSMLKAYKFDEAAALHLMILAIGILFYLIGEYLSYVSRKKLN